MQHMLNILTNKKLIPIYLLTLINFLGFTMLIPIYLTILDRFDLPVIWYGVLLSSYSVAQFFASPIIGKFSDKYGRKKLLFITQLGTTVSWVFFALSFFINPAWKFIFPIPLGFIIVLLSRILDGITGGNVSVAAAYLADETKPEERDMAYGIAGGIIGLSIIVGPLLGAVTSWSSYSYVGTSIFGVVISTIALVLIKLQVVDNLAIRNPNVQFENVLKELFIIKHIKKFIGLNKQLKNVYLLNIIFALIFASFSTLIAPYVEDTFNFNNLQIGYYFLALGIAIIIFQIYFVPKYAEELGEYKTIYAGLILISIGFTYTALTSTISLLYQVSFITMLGLTLCLSVFKMIYSKAVPKEFVGEILGVEESIMAFFTAFTPFFITILYYNIGENVFFYLSLLILLAIVVNLLLHRKDKIELEK